LFYKPDPNPSSASPRLASPDPTNHSTNQRMLLYLSVCLHID
jgi:hypothetical protein